MTTDEWRAELVRRVERKLARLMPRSTGFVGEAMKMGRRVMAERLVEQAIASTAKVKIKVPASWGPPPGRK